MDKTDLQADVTKTCMRNSDKIYYPPWKGPEILVHGRLSRLQLCVLQKVAETEDRDIVIFQAHEDGGVLTDTGEPE